MKCTNEIQCDIHELYVICVTIVAKKLFEYCFSSVTMMYEFIYKNSMFPCNIQYWLFLKIPLIVEWQFTEN